MYLLLSRVSESWCVARTVDVWPRVIEWKKRYVAEGLDGLEDRPKPGRRPVIDEVAVLCDDEMDNYATRKSVFEKINSRV
jgi:hypothetical protein